MSEKPLNRKQEMYNTLVDDMVSLDLSFHKSVVEDEGSYILQVFFSSFFFEKRKDIQILEMNMAVISLNEVEDVNVMSGKAQMSRFTR